MCGISGDSIIINITNGEDTLELLKCTNCASLNYAGDNPVVGYINDKNADELWKHYSQIGAGFTAMLEPLFALGDRFSGSLLDVGCGFGYVVDFFNKMGYGQAVGLEKASYGYVGEKLLQAPILHSYYDECSELKGKSFDLVYSCEVLEHVPDPKAFINEISAALSKDGILVLTTPSSEVLNSGSSEATILASLSPYFHFFLSSKQALENLLRDCGFKDILVTDSGSRLYAWASRSVLPTIKPAINWKDYFSYLSILAENNDPNVSMGALQRLFKDSWNTGEHGLAETTFKKLEKNAYDQYGLSFEYPDILRYLNRESATEGLEKNPAWYGSALMIAANMMEKLNLGSEKRVRMMDAACCILSYEATSPKFQQFSQEAQHWLPFAQRNLTDAYGQAFLKRLKDTNIQDIDVSSRDLIEKLNILAPNNIKSSSKSTSKLRRMFKKLTADASWWKNNWKSRLIKA
jgi:2-polyprenyl-3-methyl-5-hydroxy-6-metoxy-1,4-benzoquinol methylase